MPLSPFHSDVVVTAVWTASRPVRDHGHRAVRQPGCPTGPRRAATMLRGAPVPVSCEPCYDLLVDVLLQLHGRLDDVTDPAAYAYRAATRIAQDHLRAGNAARHGVAKPDRTDGRIGAVHRALAGVEDPGWSDELLTLVLAAACTRAPLPAQVWPYDRFAARKAARTGRSDMRVIRREVVDDVAAVIAAIDRVAGRTWRDAHVDAPLRARAAVYTDLRVGLPAPGGGLTDPPAPATCSDPSDVLREAFWSRLDSQDAVSALRDAITESGGLPLRPAALRMLAAGWLADLLALAGSPMSTRRDGAAVQRAVARVLGPAAARRLTADLVAALVAPGPGPSRRAA